MHPSRIVVTVLALISIASASASDPVLLASRRGGWIEAIDLETLKTVSRIRVPEMTESVASDPQGQRLFLTAPPPDHPKGCCALFALDPQSLQLTLLVQPSLSATVTPSGVFTQRGNVGIEAFDLLTLKRLPTINAPGVYRLRASSDGSRLLGLSNFPHPSLDLFDAVQGSLTASQPLPDGSMSAGAWLDHQFFLFTLLSGQAMLRTISPSNGQAGPVVPMSVSSPFPDCPQAPYDMIASAAKLIIYPRFGGKGDSSCQCQGGFAIADPGTSVVSDHFDSNRFAQIVASPDGRYLYGLDVGKPAWRRVQLLKMDATGSVTGQRDLDPDVWSLTGGRIPQQLQGQMDLSASAAKR